MAPRVHPGVRLGTTEQRLLLGALLILAFLLRLYRLDGQSLWLDEASSVSLAVRPAAEVVSNSIGGDHPPGYFLLLHFWLRLAGESDYAVRFLSVAAALAGLALLWSLATRLIGWRQAVVTLGLAAVAPFGLYYGQETRGYAVLMAFALLASYAYVRAVSGHPRWWALYGAAAIATLATHHAGTLVVATHTLHFLLAVRPLPRPGLAIHSALWLAWSLFAALTLAGSSPLSALVGTGELGTGLLSAWLGLAIGDTLDRLGAAPMGLSARWPPLAAAFAAPVWLSALVGTFSLWRRGSVHRLLLGLVLLPPIAAVLVSLATRPYIARYAAPSAFLFTILLAAGAAVLYRRRRPLSLLALAWTAAASLTYSGLYLLDPSFGRDNHRGAARYINQEATDGEAVILVSAYVRPALQRYLERRISLVGLPERLQADPAETVARLEEMAQHYERLWLVSWQEEAWDPEHVVRNWLEEHGFRITSEHFRGIGVRQYLGRQPVLSHPPPRATPARVQLGDVARLLAYEVAPKPTAGRLRVTLYWEPLRPLTGTNYSVFVHVISRSYYTWAQKDNRPAYDRFPTGRWRPGMVIADGYDLVMLEGTPPGSYRLEVGMYDTASGDRLLDPQSGRDHILLGPVQLAGAPAPSFAGRRPLARFAEIELLDAQWTGDLRPGGEIQLTTIWRTAEKPRESYRFALSLRGKAEEVTRAIVTPSDGENTASPWEPGRVVRVQQRLAIAETASPGTYRLELALDTPNPSQEAASRLSTSAFIDLGAVAVR